jgi:hypothetical protein
MVVEGVDVDPKTPGNTTLGMTACQTRPPAKRDRLLNAIDVGAGIRDATDRFWIRVRAVKRDQARETQFVYV